MKLSVGSERIGGEMWQIWKVPKKNNDEPAPFSRLRQYESGNVIFYYSGGLPGAKRSASHSYHCLRILPKHRFAETVTAGIPTHQFCCWYKVASTGEVKILFGSQVDCRIGGRNPDWIASKITAWLVRLLCEVGVGEDTTSQTPGIWALFFSPHSQSFWLTAILKRVEQLERDLPM